MGEAVLRRFPASASMRRHRARRKRLRFAPRRRRATASRAARSCRRAAPFRPPPQQHRAVGAAQPEGDAVAQRPLRLFGPRRQRFGDAGRRRGAIARATGTSTQRGRRGVQIVAPRSISAWAKSPARCVGISARGERPQARLAAGQRLARPANEPRHHPLDIAVDRRSGGRRRSPRSPPRYSRRSRAARAAPPRRRENARHGARRRRGRRHAGCGRARNSRAPATDAAPRRARPRRAREVSGQRARNRSK